MTENIYKAIKEIRVQKGMTQQFMADKLGLSQNNYGKLERGLIQLTIERLEQIATEFGMSPVTILTYQNGITHTSGFHPNEVANSSENRLLNEKLKLSEEKVSILNERIELLTEQKDFKTEQVHTLMAFIKSVVMLVSQIRADEETSLSENEKVYIDFIHKINYTAERLIKSKL